MTYPRVSEAVCLRDMNMTLGSDGDDRTKRLATVETYHMYEKGIRQWCSPWY